MSISLTLARARTIEFGLSFLYIELGDFGLYARFEWPSGGPWWEVSRFTTGTGVKIIAGPLVVEAGKG